MPRAYRSRPSTKTFPSTRAPGTRSCIRFSARMKVDFPHPEGPITASTVCGITPSETWRMAWLARK